MSRKILVFRIVLLAAAQLVSAPGAFAAHHYVSPQGMAFGDGSPGRPWDIVTTFAHPPEVLAGDTIWLLGGVYELPATLVSSLAGAEASPIIVRQAPHQRATLDCRLVIAAGSGPDCVRLGGRHTWYWGFEIMNSGAARWAADSGSQANPRGTGIHSQAGPGTKLINLVIHDVGLALFESQPSGIEIYGVIAYNSGWDAPDRSHGLGFYMRNRAAWPQKRLRDNIIFQHYRQGLQGYGSFRNVFSNFLVQGNIVFNNGVGRNGLHRNLMFGNDNTEHVQNIFLENFTYFPPGEGQGSNMFASPGGGCRGLFLLGNVFAHGPGRTAAAIHLCEDVEISGNLFYGRTKYSGPAGTIEAKGAEFERLFPENRYLGGETGPPLETISFARQNLYEPNRAHVVIYNWGLRCRAEVDVSELGIAPGSRYWIHNVQDYFGPPITGIYSGRTIPAPMTGWKVAQPLGDFSATLPPTFPEFGAFVLTWQNSVRPVLRSRLFPSSSRPAVRRGSSSSGPCRG